MFIIQETKTNEMKMNCRYILIVKYSRDSLYKSITNKLNDVK